MLVDTVFPCVHMKVTDNASNIKKALKFCNVDEATNRKLTDYQMIVSNDLIIKSFDTGFQLSV